MKGNLVCAVCGERLSDDILREFDGQVMCENCFYDKTVVCDNCGDRIWRDDNEGDSVHILCNHCREYSYTTCEDCGALIHNEEAHYDDDYPYCYECYEKLIDRPIKNYSYKPEPIFYGSGKMFYGVELEIDRGGESDENARTILEVANNESEHIYVKRDSSIENGFEIVSHPMTLSYHLENMPWGKVLDKALQLCYVSHNSSCCGLHIHCSRTGFGDTFEKQEKAIGRLVYFFEKFWDQLVRLSRRTPENLNRWAAKYATISKTTEETYKKAKDKRMGRYCAVNLINYSTVEIRMWRGTLRIETLIATLELVDFICQAAIRLSDKEMEAMSWDSFVSEIPPEKVDLIEYLKSKQLYVNEIELEAI